MRKTLHRQHSDLVNDVLDAAGALLHRSETGATTKELTEAMRWLRADFKALAAFELRHSRFGR
jgi:hypothetical protein